MVDSPPGNHQRVDGVEFLAASDGDRVGARFAQRRKVFAGVALQRQHTDAGYRATLVRATVGSCHSRAGVKSRL